MTPVVWDSEELAVGDTDASGESRRANDARRDRRAVRPPTAATVTVLTFRGQNAPKCCIRL